jgi:hypothetical protein
MAVLTTSALVGYGAYAAATAAGGALAASAVTIGVTAGVATAGIMSAIQSTNAANRAAMNGANMQAAALQQQGAAAAVSANMQAYAVQYEAALNEELRKYDAQEVYRQMKQQVSDIQSQALIVRGTQLAQQAVSGAVIGEGSLGHTISRTTDLAAADTLATIYSGVTREQAIRTQANFDTKAANKRAVAIRYDGNAALEASYLQSWAVMQGARDQIRVNNANGWGQIVGSIGGGMTSYFRTAA